MSFERLFGIAAVSLLVMGCKAAIINEVVLESDTPVSGKVILTDDKGQKKEVPFEGNAARFGDLPAASVVVSLDYSEARNTPAHASPRKATLTAAVDTEADSKSGKLKSAKISKLGGKVSTTATSAEAKSVIDCTSLFQAKATGEKQITVSLKGFTGLASCEGKEIEKANPLAMGRRDVSQDTNPLDRNRFSPEEDAAMGREATEQLLSINRGVIVPNTHPSVRYVEDLMRKIADRSDNPGMRPQVHFVNADVLNAFCLPGGSIFVFRGLLERSRSEAELAGVLGHEWAHAVARHGTRSVSRAQRVLIGAIIAQIVALGVEIHGDVTDDVLESVLAGLTRQLVVPGATLYLLHESREFEDEADKIGSQYAWAAGFEPWGIADMFQVFLNVQGHRSSRLETAFSDHPALESRIQHVFDLSSLFYPAKQEPYVHSSPEFARVLQSLNTLPPEGSERSFSYGNEFADRVQSFANSKLASLVKANKAVIVAGVAAEQLIRGGLLGGLGRPRPAPPLPGEPVEESLPKLSAETQKWLDEQFAK